MANTVIDALLEGAIESAMSQMDDEQRKHFLHICGALLSAYMDDSMHALVLLGKSGAPGAGCAVEQVLAVNCTDINAAELLGAAAERVGSILMADAPERGMFH